MEVGALTKAARRMLAHGQLHKAISDEHWTISKALGDLSASSTDKNLSGCCKELSKCHSALAKHHAALALPDPASTMEKPDNEDAGKTVETLPKAGERYNYNAPGASISEHTRAMLEMAGYDPSGDPITKGAFHGVFDDEVSAPAADGDPLRKRAWDIPVFAK